MASIKVGHGIKQPNCDISLSDNEYTFGFRLANVKNPFTPQNQTPSSIHFTGGGTKFGDWTPMFSHIEQRTWEGGRGAEVHENSDPTRFFDSMNAWTLTPNRLLPAPKWKFAKGLRDADYHMLGDISWKALISTRRYVSIKFTASASYNAAKVYLWLRRKGSPGVLTAELWSDSGGDPDAVLKTKTVTTSTITDVVSVLHGFEFTSVQALVSGTDYHVVIYGADTDNATNNWQIATDTSSSTSKYSSDASTWTSADFKMYYRVVDADTNRKFHYFIVDGQLYAVDEKDAQTASSLYINGDRGKATAATATTITDSNKSWTTNEWDGSRVKIVRGTGKGQTREITSNTATALTFGTLDKTPSTDSEYIIYKTDKWTELGTTGLDSPCTSVCVADNIAEFAQGASDDIRRMRYNAAASPPAHEYEDDASSNNADLLYTYFDTTNSVIKINRVLNGTTVEWSNATNTAWSAGMTFGSAVPIGDYTYPVTNMIDYDGTLFAIKEDGSLWKKTASADTWTRLNVGTNVLPMATNGVAACVLDYHLYFSWAHSVEQLYGGAASDNATLSDVGAWKGAGLPDGRQGVHSFLIGAFGWLISGIDADTGTSSVLVWNDRGWHEIFRAWEADARVRNGFLQACPGDRPRLWINVNGEMVYMDLPKYSMNPAQDSGMEFQHEAVVEGTAIDFEASTLSKYFKEANLITENEESIDVAMDYQCDDDVGTTTWYAAETFYSTPQDTLDIREGNKRRFRPRYRIHTDDADVPPNIVATVIEGFARTPNKWQLNVIISTSPYKVDKLGASTEEPDDLLEWLEQSAKKAKLLKFRSNLKKYDDTDVVIEPPVPVIQTTNTIEGSWSGFIQLTIREA